MEAVDPNDVEQARVQLERVQQVYNELFKKRTAEINELRDRMCARTRDDNDALAKISRELYENYLALVDRADGEQSK